jgi:hypothetical protein
MLRRVLAVVVGIHAAVQLAGTAIAFGLLDAGRLYETVLLAGHFELARDGGAIVGALLGVTGIAFAVAAYGLFTAARWAVPVLLPTIILSLLVTGLGEQSAVGVVVNLLILVGAGLLWRSDEGGSWAYPR